MQLDITGVVLGRGHTRDLNKGLVYLYQQDLLVTLNFSNVIVNFGLKWYRTHFDMIGTILKQISIYQKHLRMATKPSYINGQGIC